MYSVSSMLHKLRDSEGTCNFMDIPSCTECLMYPIMCKEIFNNSTRAVSFPEIRLRIVMEYLDDPSKLFEALL